MPMAPDAPDLTGKPLRIETARNGDTVTVALSGELDLATANAVKSVLMAAEETEISRIVIDLSDLSFVDSSGLSVLLRAKARSDGRLHFIPPRHDAVIRLLALTQTDELLGS
jgi:anti-sigma B factor antagonist